MHVIPRTCDDDDDDDDDDDVFGNSSRDAAVTARKLCGTIAPAKYDCTHALLGNEHTKGGQ